MAEMQCCWEGWLKNHRSGCAELRYGSGQDARQIAELGSLHTHVTPRGQRKQAKRFGKPCVEGKMQAAQIHKR